jgi:hypothetical protein
MTRGDDRDSDAVPSEEMLRGSASSPAVGGTLGSEVDVLYVEGAPVVDGQYSPR